MTLAAYKGFHEIVALLLGKPAVQVNMPEKVLVTSDTMLDDALNLVILTSKLI